MFDELPRGTSLVGATTGELLKTSASGCASKALKGACMQATSSLRLSTKTGLLERRAEETRVPRNEVAIQAVHIIPGFIKMSPTT